jgi:hypothetical protein
VRSGPHYIREAEGVLSLRQRRKGSSMSYRNGDRSREHRLRKARIARRLKINAVREAAAKPAAEAKPAKAK